VPFYLFYAYRSLLARWVANLVTTLTIVLFVAGGTLGLSFYGSLNAMLVDTAPPENIAALNKRAPTEAESEITLDVVRQILTFPGIKHDAQGPLATAESLYLFTPRTSDFTTFPAPAQLRGIGDRSVAVHRVQIIQGAAPQSGQLEVMLGRRFARRYPMLQLGSELALPKASAKITGIFTERGGPFEDEAWMPHSATQLAFGPGSLNSVTISADSVSAMVSAISATKQVELRAVPLSKLRAATAGLHRITTTAIAMLLLLASVGVFAIAMTMSAAVSRRLPELAALAACGIRKSLLARSVVVEAMLLSGVGGLIGAGIGEVVRMQLGSIDLGENPVELAATPMAPAIGVGLALVVGVIGGIAPAIAVRRLSILAALR
jgi:putative ABC transport system permease protein